MYSIQQIKEMLGCRAIMHTNNIIKHLSTDSRRISFPHESLFFALHTANRDGHNFVEDVYQLGVRNFIVEKNYTANLPGANVLFVDNTLDALQKIAAQHRQSFRYPVIGITGSNGKTIVKEWLYTLLSEDYDIVRSPRSYNSQIGVPLSVWEMNSENDLAIIEAGISKKEEMDKLEKIIYPTIGILTNIGEAHENNFSSKKEKLSEKLRLFRQCRIVFAHTDDALASTMLAETLTCEIFSIGTKASCTLRVKEIKQQDSFTEIALVYQNACFKIHIPFTDDASLHNALMCIAVALNFGLPVGKIIERILLLQPVEMRMQVLPGINNCIFINDSYSFDLQSLSIALDFLSKQPLTKTVILSDIPDAADSDYTAVTEMLKARHINRFIAIGQEWQSRKNIVQDALNLTTFYTSAKDFTNHFNSQAYANEAILIKGARSFLFETIVPLFEKKIHSTFLEVNLSAIAHNLKAYKENLSAGTRLMAMVKAFGYGSGSLEVASLLQYNHVDYLTVAYTDEAVELRDAGIHLPVMIMNIDDDEDAFQKIVTYNLEPEIYSFKILDSFISFLRREGLQQYPVHIKIDTGMHRLGFEKQDIGRITAILNAGREVVIKSVFSHLVASEDEQEDAFTAQQAALLNECADLIQQNTGYTFLRHISNSAGIIQHPELQMDMVRLGIGLYGIDSTNNKKLLLEPAIALKTTIAQIRHLKANESVGYNRKGILQRDSVIATIRIGYADGFKRKMSNGTGAVFINGKLAPVVGIVCMDMTMVDITGIDNVHEGDVVEIFGSNLPIEKLASWCETNTYEILTGIGRRVKRVYVED
ncbi:bifunctional UDP-N-acetylmuramoyl-tripeptide:D-alanyl-D-alanine ligase/alanine racemase [Haoranjiania flava]|uniref:Alanine racemase n=1 Tax=Haoranjiania flava TaxID=1856322 RepID=A0AAE3LJN5_9BACT|nr:bifunctional UDP-N-acetylmuramoyl-tripeptide:D-alanyl-D-alanine ligase/alanine racemase [Haoranjiania flava]MCU7693942.1 bifunctional UDP-N-acetylmuramoyl-tripeptide:D-alanyl-D-alanine ligase/alanine racemase [Haoranjiania flava]